MNNIKEYMRGYVQEFEELTEDLPIRGGGISRSEAFAFISLCKMYDIDLVIDSGTGRGVSCEYFARTLNHVYTIDNHNHYDNSKKISYKALSKYKNVEIIVGDALNQIPKLLKEVKHRRCGIFFDGPKGQQALNFYKKIDIYLAGFHDILPGKKMESVLSNQEGFLFHTLSTPFFEEYFKLNRNRKQTAGYPNGPGSAFMLRGLENAKSII